MSDDASKKTMRELIEEAERRGIASAEWMDRAALVRALSEADRPSLGPLARARRFLGAVTGAVRSVMDPVRPSSELVDRTRRSSAAPEPASFVAPASVPEAAIAEEGTDAPIEASVPVAESAPPAATAPAPTVVETVPSSAPTLEPSSTGLRVIARDGRSWLVWRAPSARLEAVGKPASELTLRLVSIGCAIGELDADVVVQTEDHAVDSLEGARELPANDLRQRRVAAIGVGRGEGFVALAHARIA